MDNKNITFVIASLRTGGAEKVCVTLLNSFYEDKHNVSLIVLNLKNSHLKSHLNPDIPIYNLNVLHARQAFFTLKKQLDQLKPDVCLSFNFQISVILVLYKYIFNHKYILFSRGVNTFSKKIENEASFRHKYLNSFLIRKYYRNSDFFIAQSTGMKKDMISSLGIKTDKIRVIPNPSLSLQLDATEDYNYEVNGEKRILFVGSLKEQKNVSFLIDVMDCLLEIRSDFIFNIIGDGALKSSIQDKISQLQLEQHVFLRGFVANPNSYYKNADAFVLGSLYEGFPNVLVESLYFGVPIVSIDCIGGPSDIIEDGVNGYLIKEYNANSFAQKINVTLNKDWDKDLIKSTANKFSIGKIYNQYKEYLLNGNKN